MIFVCLTNFCFSLLYASKVEFIVKFTLVFFPSSSSSFSRYPFKCWVSCLSHNHRRVYLYDRIVQFHLQIGLCVVWTYLYVMHAYQQATFNRWRWAKLPCLPIVSICWSWTVLVKCSKWIYSTVWVEAKTKTKNVCFSFLAFKSHIDSVWHLFCVSRNYTEMKNFISIVCLLCTYGNCFVFHFNSPSSYVVCVVAVVGIFVVLVTYGWR